MGGSRREATQLFGSISAPPAATRCGSRCITSTPSFFSFATRLLPSAGAISDAPFELLVQRPARS